jgi:hypothetical protein
MDQQLVFCMFLKIVRHCNKKERLVKSNKKNVFHLPSTSAKKAPLSKLSLVDVVLPGKEWRAVEELAQYAAHCPEVHSLCVPPRPRQQLRGPVPTRRHLHFLAFSCLLFLYGLYSLLLCLLLILWLYCLLAFHTISLYFVAVLPLSASYYFFVLCGCTAS